MNDDPETLAEAVLAADELLTAPGAEAHVTRLVDELAERTPVDRADQLDAARAEADRDIVSDFPPVDVWLGDHPEWVRLGLLLALGQWARDQVRVCDHRPNWDHPAPAHAAARQPGLVAGSQCRHLLGEPQRCDGCGTEIAGVLYVVTGSVFNYQLYVCPGCQYAAPQA